MKKLLLVCLFLLSGILFTACGKKEVVDDIINIENSEITSCQKAIDKYLDGSDEKGEGDSIKKGDNVVVDYIGRLEDRTVFETTIKSVAEACDIYDENIDYTHGYEFSVGMNQKLKGFDEGVIGMKVGQTKTVQFGPEDGYGLYTKNNVVKYTIDEVGDVSKLNEGEIFNLGMGMSAKIIEITDKDITLDFNHELAGKNLIFDITVKSVN